MLLLEWQGICFSLLRGLEKSDKAQFKPTNCYQWHASTNIYWDILWPSCNSNSILLFTMIIFSDNLYIPSKLALCILRCFAEKIWNRFLEFGLLAIQRSFRFQRKRLNIYFRNIMRWNVQDWNLLMIEETPSKWWACLLSPLDCCIKYWHCKEKLHVHHFCDDVK